MTTYPVFLPGKSHGQRSLLGYHRWGHKESDQTTRFKKKILNFLQQPCKADIVHLTLLTRRRLRKGLALTQSHTAGQEPGDSLPGWPDPRALPSSCLWAAQLCMCAFPSLVPHSLVYNAGLEDDASVSVVTRFCLPRMTGH